MPYVDGNRNDFFNKNGNRAGYNLTTEGRYYFMPNFALGLQYDYLRIAHSPDKMHLHYIHPNITYRYLWSNGNQGVFLSFGIGYMNYEERTYQRNTKKGFLFNRGYFISTLINMVINVPCSGFFDFHIKSNITIMLFLYAA